MKVMITQFHGINCDHDVKKWVEARGHESQFIWQTETTIPRNTDLIVIPGGFSFGDYLRCGAIAARSPLMRAVQEYAHQGGSVLGICNGFQILCEAGLLPGVLLANRQGHFIDQWVRLKVQSETEILKKEVKEIRIPIAHGEGRYFVEEKQLQEMKENQQIWMTYDSDINGSLEQIAGVLSKNKKVCGLMPHPERAYLDWMGSADGGFFL